MLSRLLLPALICLVSPALYAAPPVISNLDIRGLQSGGVTQITITGANLTPSPQLMLGAPIARQTLLDGAAPNKVQFEVELAQETPTGLYNLRLANEHGVSESVAIAIDPLPETLVSALKSKPVESLPVAVHGSLAGSTRLPILLQGNKGDEIIVEVESQRLGAKLRPVIHLYDASNHSLGWALPSPSLWGDARLTATLPGDGAYRVEIHDLQYASPAPNFFRLKIGQWKYADAAFPPTIGESATKIQLVGNNAGEASIAAPPSTLPTRARWPEGIVASGPRPAIYHSDQRQVIESAASTKVPQEVGEAPLSICGRLSQSGEVDRYLLQVKPETKLRFELQAARFGSSLDATLEILKEDGGRLAFNDDANNSPDPQLDYTIPKETTKVVIAVSDALGEGGPLGIYRVIVRDTATPTPPSFSVEFEQATTQIPLGGFAVMKANVPRSGVDSPIELSIENLPQGIELDATTVPPGADGSLLIFRAVGDSPQCSLGRLLGQTSDEKSLVQVGQLPSHPLAEQRPWLAAEFAMASYREPSQFGVAWGESLPESKLVLGAKPKLPVTCMRPIGEDGPVRLTLLTSQSPPTNNGKPDANRTLRMTAATIEIAADATAQKTYTAVIAAEKAAEEAKKQTMAAEAADPVDAAKVEAAQAKKKEAEEKLAAANKAAAEASAAAKNSGEAPLIVPGDLSAATYQVAIKAELLSRDKRTVVATRYTQPHTLVPVNPLLVQLAETRFETVIDPKAGATVTLAGKIERTEKMAGDVTVTIEGLPPGVAAPKATIKADASEFSLAVKFPASAKPGDIAGVRIVASGKFEASSPIPVTSRSADVTIVLQAAEPESK